MQPRTFTKCAYDLFHVRQFPNVVSHHLDADRREGCILDFIRFLPVFSVVRSVVQFDHRPGAEIPIADHEVNVLGPDRVEQLPIFRTMPLNHSQSDLGGSQAGVEQAHGQF